MLTYPFGEALSAKMPMAMWHFVSELQWYFHISLSMTKSELG